MLADQFPRTRSALKYVEEKYNKTFRLRWDKSVDFVKLHYCITKRKDTQYWIDNCKQESIPEALQQRLNHWKSHPPTKYDFDYAYEPFVLDSYLFVLYGMQFDADLSHNKSAYARAKEAKAKFDNVQQVGKMLTTQLPSHRELVEKVYQFGFSKI
jgi:tryptophan halogenase